MKKISAMLLIVILSLTLISCSSSNVSLYNASYWLDDSSNYGIGRVNETNVYSISYISKNEDATTKISVDSTTSNYTTLLTNTVFGEAKTVCYLYETTLLIKGEVTIKGETVSLDDNVSTKCYFLGVENSLKPLYSERKVNSHSLYIDNNGEYSVKFYDYMLKSTYSDAVVSVDFSIGERNNGIIDLSPGVKEYTDIDFKSHINEELLLFAPRAMTLNENTTKSFYTIDSISGTNRKMKLSPIAADPIKTIALDNYYRNFEKFTEVTALAMQISIDSKYSGSPMAVYYADSANKKERSSVIRIESSAIYDLGTYIYTIKSAVSN